MRDPDIIFEETSYLPLWMRTIAGIVIAGVALGCGVPAAQVLPSNLTLAAGLTAAAILPSALIAAIVLPAMHVTVDANTFHCRWTIFFSKAIERRDIERAIVVHVDPIREFGGWGQRWDFIHRRMGAIARRGPAVEIFARSRRNSLVVTSTRAAELADLLSPATAEH